MKEVFGCTTHRAAQQQARSRMEMKARQVAHRLARQQKLTHARWLPYLRPKQGQQQELRTTVLRPQQVAQTPKKLGERLLWALQKGRPKVSG